MVPGGGGAARVLVGENEPYDVDQAIWSTDGKSIYFLANLGVHEELFVVPAAGGKPRQLTDGKHNIGSVVAVAAIGSRSRSATRRAPATSGRWTPATPRRREITHVFDYLARDFKLGRQEAIQWKGADGVTVEGAAHLSGRLPGGAEVSAGGA